jgi:DNA topoisomerase-1
VWICKKTSGHIQATGIDSKGRKQYIYHPKWIINQQMKKYDALVNFFTYLPKVRRSIAKDLRGKCLSKKQVVAAVIRIIDKSQIRVGKHYYSQTNGTRGATTLTTDNVNIEGNNIRLTFVGKSHVERYVNFNDKKVAQIIKHCQELNEQYLFTYLDSEDQSHAITSTDINDYLFNCCEFSITAKDFRTWWANVHFLESINTLYIKNTTAQPLKKWITTSIKNAALELGHTPTICRNSYLHPNLISACENNLIYDWLKKLNKKSFRSKRYLSIAELKFHNVLKEI